MSKQGAPFGNQNAVKAKRWQQAIDRALERRTEKSRAEGIAELDRLADEFLKAVEMEGIVGYKELADRLDGKPAQQIQLGGDDGEPLRIIHESK